MSDTEGSNASPGPNTPLSPALELQGAEHFRVGPTDVHVSVSAGIAALLAWTQTNFLQVYDRRRALVPCQR